MREKRPRHYAAEIIELPTKEERRAYLSSEVPEHYQEMVRKHVINDWALKKARANA